MIEDLTCRFCGEGSYRDVVDPKRAPHALHKEGFAGLGRVEYRGWRILECDRCQNIQLFRLTVEESELRGDASWRTAAPPSAAQAPQRSRQRQPPPTRVTTWRDGDHPAK